MRILSALAVLLLLAGCQATFWAQPPLPAGGCDPAVQGRWYSDVDYPDEGESRQVRLNIDARCQVVATQILGGAVSYSSSPTSIGMAQLRGQSYVWMNANSMLTFNGHSHRTQAGDVVVFRYRVEGENLLIWEVNHLHLRNLISSGAIAGGIDDNEMNEFNRITGPVAPVQLAAPEFFYEEATRSLWRSDPGQ